MPVEPMRRPERDTDAAFRFALFRDSRHPLEALPGLDPVLADGLMRQQFAGQEASYRAAHAGARRDIVEVGGVPVGRLVIEESAAAWTVVDIALLSAWRGRGLGTRLLAEVIAGAHAAGCPVRLRVMAHNAGAARLYRRLGFVATETSAVDVAMERLAGDPPCREGALRPPDRLRLPLAFDAAAMASEVEALAATDWIRHFVVSNFEGEWDVIPLRARAGVSHPSLAIVSDPTCRDYADTPFLTACPAIGAALARFGCPLDSVRLMRLAPGSTILEHRDHDLAFEEGSVRVHVPIVTNPDVHVLLNGHRIVMEAGSAWYLRLSDPHSVANRGGSARVHLVIDARVDAWVEDLFARALAEA